MSRLTSIFAFTLFVILPFTPCFAQQATTERAKLAREMEYSIQQELLNVWYPKAVDLQHGGFLSTFTHDFKPTEPQDKMIVTQARHTWANAKALLMYPEIPHYRTAARHGYVFLRDVMWDKQKGGFYTLVDQQGNLKDNSKTAYGNAFGIYALTAYYQATGDTTALDLAKKTFYWLEKHSHDPIHKGYYQHLNSAAEVMKRDSSTPSTSDLGYKDQNSSIHLLEAFTDLYGVWPDPLLRRRLQEMLELVRDTITTERGYMVLYFQPDWTPLSFQDSSRASILKHRYLDHVSYGHDVETAYLMLEASHMLGLEHDEKTRQVAKKMVDHALRTGWDTELGGFYDEGYYFKGEQQPEIIRDSKNWWAQAEGLNSLLLMANYYPQDEMHYYQKFKQLWEYTQEYLIDHEWGDWYQGGLDKEPQQKTALKGQIWKANYHQLRAMMNCVQRLRPDSIPPATPKDLKLDRNARKPALSWSPSTDNNKLLGYNIYQGKQKIGFTPQPTFWLTDAKSAKGQKFSVQAVDLHGNLSAKSKAVSLR